MPRRLPSLRGAAAFALVAACVGWIVHAHSGSEGDCAAAFPLLSRSTTPSETNAIAVAVMQQLEPPSPLSGQQTAYMTIDGKDPAPDLLPRLSKLKDPVPGLLPRLSGDGIIAKLGSLVHPTIHTDLRGGFTVSIPRFRVSPFGRASGMVDIWCGNVCGTGTCYRLRKQNGEWRILSKQLIRMS